jgi:glycerol uptake facilitator protein
MQTSSFLGEMMGTLVLILLGNGVVANVVLDKSKGQNAGWIVITAGWAFAVTMGIFVAQKFGSEGAHLNPAVTLAMAIKSGDWSFVPTCILAQMLGAILGSVLVWLAYLPHWAETRDQSAKLAAFCNAPAVRNTTANLITEIIATMMLIIGVVSIYGGEKSGVAPFLVGILVWAIGLSLGGSTGYAINPARDLGPRIAHALLPISGKGGSDWGYSWIPVVGPMIGALLAGGFLKMFGF